MTKLLSLLATILVAASSAIANPISQDQILEHFKTDVDRVVMSEVKLFMTQQAAGMTRGLPSPCSDKTVDDKIADALASHKRGEPMSEIKLKRSAMYSAACVMTLLNAGGTPEYARHAANAGIALTLALLMEGVTETSPTVDRAIAYLDYAAAHGMAEVVKGYKERLFAKINPTADVSRDSKDAIIKTAEGVSAEFMANRVAFKIKYDKQPFIVTGRVLRILGDEKQLTVRLLGNSKKAREDLVNGDYVQCEIKDPASITKALGLKEGQNAKVHGVYLKEKQYQYALDEILLRDCRVM